jgi:hypothetical protein
VEGWVSLSFKWEKQQTRNPQKKVDHKLIDLSNNQPIC